MTATIHHADAVQWARDYTGDPFHSLLCDPPYSLQFMNKKWDGDVAFRADTWAAFANVLHDGAFIMAFASSRGWHRQAVAMEDAGLIIHPSVFGLRMMGWCAGSGFPKATRVKDAPAFAGHRYGLQAMKPALEPIIVAQKPYRGKPVDCIVRTGAGAINVEGGRIGVADWGTRQRGGTITRDNKNGTLNDTTSTIGKVSEASLQGRWPANFYVDEAGAAALDAQSGETSQGHWTHKRNIGGNGIYGGGGYADKDEGRKIADTGGASRFFFNAVADQIDDADAVGYYAKASRKERDAGLEGFERTRDAHNLSSNACARCGKRVKANGSGEKCECGELRETIKLATTTRNPHPTIKPISLTRWLATLLLPPAIYAPRRLFVPFAGAGSECIGAGLAGWDEVVGVEMMNDTEHPYVDIARARIAHWLAQPALIGGAA
jgi:hypothetical protein